MISIKQNLLNYNTFYFTVGTILVTRIWLYFTHISSPYFLGVRLHHYMYGVIIFLLGYFFKRNILIGVGLGLFIDELPLVLRYGNTFLKWEQYDSLFCKVGVLAILLIYLLAIRIYLKKKII